MKDQLFNAEKVAWLAGCFEAPFDRAGFQADVMAELPALELKARMDWIAECLTRYLSPDFPQAVAQVRAALPPPLDPTLTDDDFGDFIIAPLGEWVVKAGLEDHPDLSLDLLEELTQRFSMEWALRPFLNHWPDKTWAALERWAEHENYHVRRLVSEGTRPRLPWGMAVDLAPGAALPLLDKLYHDHTRYVTRSVSNHLNDISKHDSDLVADRLGHWAGEGRQAAGELDWMTRHALRSLIKAGDGRALALLGYDPALPLEAALRLSPDPVQIGSALDVEVEIRAAAGSKVLVDYVFHFHRPNGRAGRKVFKMKQGQVPKTGMLKLAKRHPLKGNASTFTLHPGPHRIEVQINGQIRAGAEVALIL